MIKLAVQSVHKVEEMMIWKSRDFEHHKVDRETLGAFLDINETFELRAIL